MSCQESPSLETLLERSLLYGRLRRSSRPVRCIDCGVVFLRAADWAAHFAADQ